MTEVGNVHASNLGKKLLVIENNQKLDPTLASVSVIVLSAAGELPESGDLVGGVGYVPKPIKQKQVVLVVDDEAAIGRMLDLALSQGGFAVRLAATGKEAVEIYRKHHDEIALALLDVQMPEMDGPATLAALQKINPAIKCCFMSACTGKYTSQELLDMGADQMMMKPFANLPILIRLLWDVIGGRSKFVISTVEADLRH